MRFCAFWPKCGNTSQWLTLPSRGARAITTSGSARKADAGTHITANSSWPRRISSKSCGESQTVTDSPCAGSSSRKLLFSGMPSCTRPCGMRRSSQRSPTMLESSIAQSGRPSTCSGLHRQPKNLARRGRTSSRLDFRGSSMSSPLAVSSNSASSEPSPATWTSSSRPPRRHVSATPPFDSG